LAVYKLENQSILRVLFPKVAILSYIENNILIVSEEALQFVVVGCWCHV